MPHLAFAQLEQHQWKDRVLLIFAKNEKHPHFLAQTKLLEQQKAALLDRDLLTYKLFSDNTGHYTDDTPLDTTQAGAFQDRFNPEKQNFLMILIGKDGGVKLRSDQPVPPSSLFGLIDGMPMRRAELRRKKSG